MEKNSGESSSMGKLDKVIDYIKDGSVLLIKRSDLSSSEPIYDGYIVKYDGSIFKDVLLIKSENILTQFPSIEKQLDNGFSYHVVYDFENKKYQSSIIGQNKKERYKTLISEEIIEDFQVLSGSFLDGMIDLDIKIASKTNTNQEKQKKKVS